MKKENKQTEKQKIAAKVLADKMKLLQQKQEEGQKLWVQNDEVGMLRVKNEIELIDRDIKYIRNVWSKE